MPPAAAEEGRSRSELSPTLGSNPVVRVGAQRADYLVYFKIAIIVSMVFLAVIKHVSTPFFFTLNIEYPLKW